MGLPGVKLTYWDSLWFSGFHQGKFGALQIEVKENCQVLSKFSSALFAAFLNALKAVMRDRNLFQELTHEVSKVLTARICKSRDIPDLAQQSLLLRHNR